MPEGRKASSLELPPTGGQCVAIERMCRALGIREQLEDRVRNRLEARDLMFELKGRLRGKRK